jgi:hypothetical protein
MSVVMSRAWAMPNARTFEIAPIRGFVLSYLSQSKVSVDPFAGWSRLATHRNDLNPDAPHESHDDAETFLRGLDISADLGFFDPPYSPRQIAECYRGVGREVGMEGTQNALLYRRVRDALDKLIDHGGVVLSFGWNSAGMGIKRGYELIEILLVNHGGAHNDTICVAERKSVKPQAELI